ncbi:MAG: CbtA family protein [Devosia sp.]
MKLFQRLVFAAVLAGLAAGIGMSALQQWKLAPLILVAEAYEAAAPAHEHADAADEAGGHVHDAEAWAPADGLERNSYTVLANLLTSIGFALLLAALSVLSGIGITARNGALWGLGGFVAFQLAPAVELPPELPGMAAAELGARQFWWWGTALATGAGLLAVAKFRTSAAIAAAALLILAPQIIGAPQLAAGQPGVVPAGLASAFAAASLAVGAAFWLTMGPLLGWLDQRFARHDAPSARGSPAVTG